MDYVNPLMGVKFSYPDSWHFNSGLYGYEPSCSGRDKVPGTEQFVDPGNMYCSFKLKPDSSYATFDIKAIRGQYRLDKEQSSYSDSLKACMQNVQNELGGSFIGGFNLIFCCSIFLISLSSFCISYLSAFFKNQIMITAGIIKINPTGNNKTPAMISQTYILFREVLPTYLHNSLFLCI